MKLARVTASALASAVLGLALSGPCLGQATVNEEKRVLKTFAYGDPDPVPLVGPLFPYFPFRGFSARGVDREWTMVRLENPFIRIFVTPEIGGKIWGGVEKSTGREFLYFNKAVEFREIAMRGPYTAGGIELNFGLIGHAPSTASPVDYEVRTNADGSVSAIVGTIDLPSRSQWRVEVRVPKDKAYVETECLWYNPTPLRDSYYNWLTGTAIAAPDLRFFYPGTHHIGHGGEVGAWPVDARGRDLSFYRNNDFESHKSYHILGEFGEAFGGYWETQKFGYGHWAPYSDKPGMKLWLWSLGRDGEIWTDLLLEGEKHNYVEMQTGLLYNQAAEASSLSPFKHYALEPYAVHRWKEIWFPVKDIGGLVTASPFGALNVTADGAGGQRIGLSPLQAIDDDLTVRVGGRTVFAKRLVLKPLESFIVTVAAGDAGAGPVEVDLGNGKLRWSSADRERNKLGRPLAAPPDYDWKSAEGLFMAGEELVRQREWDRAKAKFEACLAAEPYHLRALTRLAELRFRRAEYEAALELAKRVLSVDAYDAEGNFIYGCVNRALGRRADAKDGFGWASRSAALRIAAWTELAALAVEESDFARAADYARRSVESNAQNVPGYEILAAACRRLKNAAEAGRAIEALLRIDPLNHTARFERHLLDGKPESLRAFASMIRNELPQETYLELAAFYARLGLGEEARRVLESAPEHPLADYWLAHLLRDGEPAASRARLEKAVAASPAFVFPYRREMLPVFRWAAASTDSWKAKYGLGLILWNCGRTDEALGLFDACADKPDFAPFYIARAKLAGIPGAAAKGVSGDGGRILRDLEKAVSLEPEDWKVRHVLFERLIKEGRFATALERIEPAHEKAPGNYVLAMDRAKALLYTEKFDRALSVLKSTRILPYEGAWEGHDLYRRANLHLAARDISAGAFAKAARQADAAREWPENLGVGKPFDTDERLENYLLAAAYDRLGRKKEAKARYEAIVRDTGKFRTGQTAGHFIGALALKELGKAGEAEALIEEWRSRDANDPVAAWAAAEFRGDASAARAVLGKLKAATPGYPWNLALLDRDFPVVLEIREALGGKK